MASEEPLAATREQMKARVRKQLAGPSLVDELIRERRDEAQQEDDVSAG